MNDRLISALPGLFAQPKPRPIFCAAHPPCSTPGAISNGTISLHDRAVSPSLIGSSTLSSYIAALCQCCAIGCLHVPLHATPYCFRNS
ncbi:hypothetical protein HDV63DRAFT_170190 [Trichoderma sp. SZMC 28014]